MQWSRWHRFHREQLASSEDSLYSGSVGLIGMLFERAEDVAAVRHLQFFCLSERRNNATRPVHRVTAVAAFDCSLPGSICIFVVSLHMRCQIHTSLPIRLQRRLWEDFLRPPWSLFTQQALLPHQCSPHTVQWSDDLHGFSTLPLSQYQHGDLLEGRGCALLALNIAFILSVGALMIGWECQCLCH